MKAKASVRIEAGDNVDMSVFAQAVQARAGEIAEAVAEEARRIAPRRTGKLEKSISAKRIGDVWVVHASAPHAHLVEFGHELVRPYTARTGGGGVIGTVAPRPFLRPALDLVIMDAMSRASMRVEWRG